VIFDSINQFPVIAL